MTDYPARPRRLETVRKAPGDLPTVRAFVAIFPPDPILDALTDLRKRLEPVVPGVRWVSSSNLHYTLRFFGDIGNEDVRRATDVLDAVARETVPFELELSGIGVFPGWKRPRILWVGAGGGGAVLEALARTLERGFRNNRLGKADKRFVPHLTLGRWRDVRGLDLVEAEKACEAVESVAAFTVSEVGVIQSRLSPKGSTYVPIHRARFTKRDTGR